MTKVINWTIKPSQARHSDMGLFCPRFEGNEYENIIVVAYQSAC